MRGHFTKADERLSLSHHWGFAYLEWTLTWTILLSNSTQSGVQVFTSEIRVFILSYQSSIMIVEVNAMVRFSFS